MRHEKLLGEVLGMAGFICAATFGTCASAQTAGETTIDVGWLRVDPLGTGGELTTTTVGGVTVNQLQPGTKTRTSTEDTAAIIIERYITDNVGVAAVAAFPFKSKLIGDGTLGKYGTIGTASPQAPMIEVRYHFFAADAALRPYVALGVNYTRFKNVRVTSAELVTDSVGPGGSERATLSSSWNPLIELGARYAITKRWSVAAGLNYLPLKSTLTVHGETAGGLQVVAKSKVHFDALNMLVSLGYTF